MVLYLFRPAIFDNKMMENLSEILKLKVLGHYLFIDRFKNPLP